MGLLDGQIALVTGGARGQGAAEARLFCSEGAKVAICDVLVDEGQRLAEELRNSGSEAQFFRLDVTSEAGWNETVARVNAWAGEITILVNNAGIINRVGILDTTADQWNRVINVNLQGPFLGMKATVPSMLRAGRGSIINIGSMASYMGLACAAYTSSKTAIIGLTRCAATEFAASNIRVNTVCPGTIETELNRGASHLEPMRKVIPQGRLGTVQDVAKAVLFLASDLAAHVTGVDLPVDGGITAGGAFFGIPLQPADNVKTVGKG